MINDDPDADNVARYFQQPAVAEFVSRRVNRRLHAIEGYEELPKSLQHRIHEQAVLIYAAGYTHAVTRRD